MAFGIIDRSQLGRSLAMLIVALENTAGTLSLASNNSSHLGNILRWLYVNLICIYKV